MTKTNTFEVAHAFTSRWEGGFINHPSDPGGATNFGVSLRWLTGAGLDITGDGKIDIADIRAMTPEVASKLFKEYFWDYLKLDRLPPLSAIVTYDAAVNTGCAQAVKFLQRGLNLLAPCEPLLVDGIIGPKTRARAVGLGLNSDATLATYCINGRNGFYRQLVDNKPKTYAPFLGGWLNRTMDLTQYLNGLEI